MRNTGEGRLYPKGGRATRAGVALLALALLLSAACLPKSPTGARRGGERSITLYGFSVMKEVMDKAIIPAFTEKWKREHGDDAKFTSSYAGSETITNQILQGSGAQVGIF